MSSKYIIILGGGVGSRLGRNVSKQFIEIDSKPIIVHTIDKYLQIFSIEIILIVINPIHKLLWKKITHDFPYLRKIKIIHGGKQRFYSVKNVLRSISFQDQDLIGIHDAVRPFVSLKTIENAFETASSFGNGVPVFQSVNTLRVIKGNNNQSIDRSLVKEVQNPQVFSAKILKKSYKQRYKKEFLDDATVVEASNIKIHLCEGNYENIKITYHQDLYLAQALFTAIKQENNGNICNKEELKIIST